MALKKSDFREIIKNQNATDEEKISEILELAHAEVDAIKTERDTLKTQLAEAQKGNSDKENEWKTKYESEHDAFEKYKSDQAQAAELTAKENAYKQLLTDAGVSNKLVDLVVRASAKQISDIKLKDGKIEGADELTKSIKAEYKDYIVDTQKKGADLPNPPKNDESNDFEKMSLGDKMAYANEHPDAPEVKTWLSK